MELRINLKNAEELIKGTEIVSEDLGFVLCDEKSADITVTTEKAEENITKVEYKDGNATITYGRKVDFFRGLMLLCMNVSEGKKEVSIEEKPFLKLNGMQLDLSRNNSLNEESIKYFIRQHAIMGLNSLTLYMEDMYVIDDEPYFGYMRGRYEPEKLKRLDDYAYELGVELIAELELLAHMDKFLRHYDKAYLHGASRGEFMVGEDATYEIIEKMVKSISSSLRSRIVHIGLDEARNMNQGPYKEKHGDVPIEKVFFEHAHKVCDIVKKYGMIPVLSGDMPFEFSWKGEPPKNYSYLDDSVELRQDIIDSMPQDIAITMWNYFEEDEEKACSLFRKTRQLCDMVVYMGSARMYQSLLCKYEPTVKTMTACMKAAKRENIEYAVFCTWQDSADCPHFLALPVGIIAAELDYVGEYSHEEMQRKVKFLYGVDYDDFYKMGRADHVHQNEDQELATKFLLYNDPLMGLLDYHVKGLDLRKFYGDMVKDYRNRGNAKNPAVKLAFDQFKGYLDVLELKADFGVRLKKAYDDKDIDALKNLANDARIIKSRFEKLMEIDRELFTFYFQGLGFETIELRRATMVGRFETTAYKIEKFIAGEISEIQELEQERLPYNQNPFENTTENIFYGTGFTSILSLMM